MTMVLAIPTEQRIQQGTIFVLYVYIMDTQHTESLNEDLDGEF